MQMVLLIYAAASLARGGMSVAARIKLRSFRSRQEHEARHIIKLCGDKFRVAKTIPRLIVNDESV